LLLGLPVAAAGQSPLKFGTWRLDAERSQLRGAPPIEEIRIYQDRGAGVIYSTREGIGSDGEPFFSSYAAKFDGPDYPRVVLGSGRVSTIAFTGVDDRTENFVVKVEGRVTMRGQTAVSADGQTLTTTISNFDAGGRETVTRSVYTKEPAEIVVEREV